MHSADELYERLIAPIEARMMGIVSRIVGPTDEANDVFQEVLAEVWERLAKIDSHPNPHAYILRVCISQSHEALRRRRRLRQREQVSASNDLAKAQAPATEKPSLDPESIDLLYDAIRSLPPHQGKAILLRIADDTSYEAIGSILGCSEAAARSHVSKGKDRLRKILADSTGRSLFG